VGDQFAMMEAVVALSVLLKNYDFEVRLAAVLTKLQARALMRKRVE